MTIVGELQRLFPQNLIVLLPNRFSPLKQPDDRWPTVQQKLAMMQAVLLDLQESLAGASLRLELCELQRNAPSYTSDTLRYLQGENICRAVNAGRRHVALVLGWDSFCSLPLWRDWEFLLGACHFLVFCRPSQKPLCEPPHELLVRSEYTLLELNEPWSSRDLRQWLAAGRRKPWDYLLGPRQWTYIRQHGLYQ